LAADSGGDNPVTIDPEDPWDLDDLIDSNDELRKYEDQIVWYLQRCSELLDVGFECCGIDELRALYTQQIDARCLQPWADHTGCMGGFFAPKTREAVEERTVGFNATRTSAHVQCPEGFFCPVSTRPTAATRTARRSILAPAAARSATFPARPASFARPRPRPRTAPVDTFAAPGRRSRSGARR
jgi:hypothetical protein